MNKKNFKSMICVVILFSLTNHSKTLSPISSLQQNHKIVVIDMMTQIEEDMDVMTQSTQVEGPTEESMEVGWEAVNIRPYFSEERQSKGLCYLNRVLINSSIGQVLLLLKDEDVKEQLYKYVCESNKNLTTAFLILNKVLKKTQLIEEFFEALDLPEQAKKFLSFLDYEKYVCQCKLSCDSLYFSYSFYKRVNRLFKSLLRTPPKWITRLESTSYFLKEEELNEMLDQVNQVFMKSSVLDQLIYQDLMIIIENTKPFIQPRLSYLESHVPSRQFIEELRSVKEEDIDFREVLGRGIEGVVCGTKKRGIVAKKTFQDMKFESDYLNNLYGYQFSKVDEKNPKIMYMKRIQGASWNSIEQSINWTKNQKILILEDILDGIYQMKQRGIRHNDLNKYNILVEVMAVGGRIYFLDPLEGSKACIVAEMPDEGFELRYKKIKHHGFEKSIEEKWSPEEELVYFKKKENLLKRWYQNSPLSRTILHRACWREKTQRLSRLLVIATDVDERDISFETPLMVAVCCSNSDNVSLLLEHGANPNLTNIKGESVLMIAIELGCFENVKRLIQSGKVNINEKNKQEKTALIYAIEEKNVEIVQYLLKHGADPNQGSCQGKNALMLACMQGSESIVELLLKCRNININFRNDKGLTALSLATYMEKTCPKERKEVFKRITEKVREGASISEPVLLAPSTLAKKTNKEEVIMLGSDEGDIKSSYLLNEEVEDSDLISDSDEEEVEDLGLISDSDEASEFKEVDVVDEEKNLITAVQSAAQSGILAKVRKVIQSGKVDINMKDPENKTALIYAIEEEDSPLVKYLLENGADPNQGFYQGKSALMLACMKGDELTVNLLLEDKSLNIDFKDENQLTALDLAVYREKTCKEEKRGSFRRIIKQIKCLTSNLEPMMTDSIQQLDLFSEQKRRCDSSQEKEKARGGVCRIGDIEQVSQSHQGHVHTELMSACDRRDEHEVTRILKSQNLDIHYQNERGETALSVIHARKERARSATEKNTCNRIIRKIEKYYSDKKCHYGLARGSLQQVIDHPVESEIQKGESSIEQKVFLSSEETLEDLVFFYPTQLERIKEIECFCKTKNVKLEITMKPRVYSSHTQKTECLAQNQFFVEGRESRIEISISQAINDIAYLAKLSNEQFNYFIHFVILNEVLQSLHAIEEKHISFESLTKKERMHLETGSLITSALILLSMFPQLSIDYLHAIVEKTLDVGKDYFYVSPELVHIDCQDIEFMILTDEEKKEVKEEHKYNRVNSKRMDSNRLKELFELISQLSSNSKKDLTWSSLEKAIADKQLDTSFDVLAEKCFILLSAA